jgi:nucleoside phosphorylase
MSSSAFAPVTLDDLRSYPAVEILLLTAVPVELRAVLDEFKAFPDGRAPIRVQFDESTYYVGICGQYVCAAVMCEAGSTGRAGSLATAMDAITRLRPHAAIMVGIAFAKGGKKQQIGDVLIATQVIQYEIVRVEKDGEGFRGSRPEPGIVLKGRLRDLATTRPPASLKDKIHLGPILSGEKLVDSPEFKARLLEAFPDAAGGEMEGSGLYSAAERRKVEWAIVKAFSDLGVRKKDEDQEVAARNAVALVAALLSEAGLGAEHFGGGTTRTEATDALTLTRAMSMEEVGRRVRDSNREREHRSDQLVQLLEQVKSSGSSPTPEQRQQIKGLVLRRDQAIEDWLNAYDEGSAKYVKGAVDKEHFKLMFAVEVHELFTTDGPHKARLYPREQSKYPALWAVFEEWNRGNIPTTAEGGSHSAPAEPQCNDDEARAEFAEARRLVQSPHLPRREQAYELLKRHTTCPHRDELVLVLSEFWRSRDLPITDADRLTLLRHLGHARAWALSSELMDFWMTTSSAAKDPLALGLQGFFYGNRSRSPWLMEAISTPRPARPGPLATAAAV